MLTSFTPRQRRPLVPCSLLLVGLVLSGCAHSYRVKVDALYNPHVTPGTSYRIVAHDDVKADYDPAYASAVQLIEAALANRGYYRADVPRDADMVVEIDLGIGSQRKRAIEDPAFVSTALLRQATINGHDIPARNFTGENAPEAPPPPPQTRVTVVTVYQKYLTLSARETERATGGLRDPVELWRVNVAIEDADETVHACLPVLVVTAIDKIGTSTGALESVRVSDRIPAVLVANAEL